MIFNKLLIENAKQFLPYFKNCDYKICEYSAGVKITWGAHYHTEFAEENGALFFKDKIEGETYFHYPMILIEENASEITDEKKCGYEAKEAEALDKIEKYCEENKIKLKYINVPKKKLQKLIERYVEVKLTNDRTWRDYLYTAKDFIEYPGKKFSGQRNHVNKFNKNYPDAEFKIIEESDIPQIVEFLKKHQKRQELKNLPMAKVDAKISKIVAQNFSVFNFVGVYIKVEGKIVAVSIAEYCGNQMVVHLEKCFTEFEGVYPTIAQFLAKTFVTSKIKYINREDDSGDLGLRKSKLQYNPIKLVDKYIIKVNRSIDKLQHQPTLKSERLTIKKIEDEFAEDYFKLCADVERNKFWGYDYLKDNPKPDKDFFMEIIKTDFENRVEMPLGVFLNDILIGETVLHNFTYNNSCEAGVRLLEKYQGFGYAQEAVETMINYALSILGIEIVNAKCYKANEKSKKMLLASGLRFVGEDNEFYYFQKTAKN